MDTIRRYYSGVGMRATTTSCSALALILALPLVAAAKPKPTPPLSLFPIRGGWTLALNAHLSAPPAIVGGRGYFVLESGLVAAYDLSSGDQLWTAEAMVTVGPAASDDLVFIAEEGSLAAIHAADGAPAWRFPFTEKIVQRLVWDNGWLIVATESGGIEAFRATDGMKMWRYDAGSAAHAPPALAADRVYVPTNDGRIVSLRIETGMVVWTASLGAAPNEIMAVDDRLYVGSLDKFLYCINTTNGVQVWRWRTGATVIGLPALDERRVYLVSLDNTLRALDRKSGAQIWKRQLPMRPIAGPRKVAEEVLVTGLAVVRGYKAADGLPAGDIPAASEMAAEPYVLPASAGQPLPVVLLIMRDVAAGDSVETATRQIDPLQIPLVGLPNPTLVPGMEPPAVGSGPTTTPAPLTTPNGATATTPGAVPPAPPAPR